MLQRTVYHAVNSVDGATESQMITYAILATLLGIIFTMNVEKSMYQRMIHRDIATDFFRPTNTLLCYLAEDIGMAIGGMINRFLPMLIFVSIFFYQPVPANLPAFFLFIISVIMSFGILWLIEAIVGVSHMYLLDVGTFVFIKDAVIIILSGSVIPIWFLPGTIRTIIGFLPFQHIYQTPLGIYIGKYSLYEALVSMQIQAIWIFALFIILFILWKNVRKRLMIQGG